MSNCSRCRRAADGKRGARRLEERLEKRLEKSLVGGELVVDTGPLSLLKFGGGVRDAEYEVGDEYDVVYGDEPYDEP